MTGVAVDSLMMGAISGVNKTSLWSMKIVNSFEQTVGVNTKTAQEFHLTFPKASELDELMTKQHESVELEECRSPGVKCEL